MNIIKRIWKHLTASPPDESRDRYTAWFVGKKNISSFTDEDLVGDQHWAVRKGYYDYFCVIGNEALRRRRASFPPVISSRHPLGSLLEPGRPPNLTRK